MSLYSKVVNPEISNYIIEKSVREHPVMKRIREENIGHYEAHMQISPDQAQFITCFIKILNPKLVLELGTYFGYSALSIALGLQSEGKIIVCEIDEEFATKAKSYFSDAGLSEKIEVKISPALDTMQILLTEGYAEKFDFIFIDADKGNYYNYYELALKLVRVGGVIAIDNVLWYGRIIDTNEQGKITNIIREFNDKIGADDRVFISIIPIGDGMTLAIKK
jgi:predicted O-methyltransferase YrrM